MPIRGWLVEREKAAVMEEIEPASTLPKLLANLVATRGKHDAIATVGETLSYEELERRASRMARALLALGAGKSARIALLAPGGILWLTALLAGLRIGALVSLVSTLCTPPELAHMLRNGDAQILIGVRRFLRHDYGKTLAGFAGADREHGADAAASRRALLAFPLAGRCGRARLGAVDR
jgi:acyl-CoA synthetase (AMP-forming)/AMP-acid ligase II